MRILHNTLFLYRIKGAQAAMRYARRAVFCSMVRMENWYQDL
jgi:hypothetical protein